MKLATITREDNVVYLTQEIDTDSIYEKAKTIVHFCDKEIKTLEKEIDRVILEIFERNGINIPNTTKSVLKKAFEVLNANGKDIVVNDLYTQNYLGCIKVRETKLFNIYMEHDNGKEYLQAGVEIKEELL